MVENCIVPPESKVKVRDWLFSPVPWHTLWEAEKCDSRIRSFLNRGAATSVCQSRGTTPDVHPTLQWRVNYNNLTTSRTLRNLGWTSPIPEALLPTSNVSSVTSLTLIGESSPSSSSNTVQTIQIVQILFLLYIIYFHECLQMFQ